jgi:tetratricopeptide (TPR) repeat protein
MKTTVNKDDHARNTTATSSGARSRRKRVMMIAVPSVLLVLAVVAAGGYWFLSTRVQPLVLPKIPAHLSMSDLGLAGWQQYQQTLPTNALNDPQLPQTPQADGRLAALQDAAGQMLIQQGQLVRGLAYMQAAAQSEPDNLRYANDYRLALRYHGRYGDEEAFFSKQSHITSSPVVLINLALSYVDEMRSCPKPPDGLVCQAQYSSRSIDVLNGILAQHPYNIIARYARGLNHLYWPTLMGHLPQSQTDLQFAVALTRLQSTIGSAFTPQAYAALGDVFAKAGQTDKARNVWLNGETVAPGASILKDRLAIPQDQLTNEENGPLRGLGVYVETDVAIFWQRR